MSPTRPPALHHSLAWVTFGNVVSKLLMFAATIFVANRVREEGFGALSTAFTVVNYLSLFAFAGVDTVTTRETAVTPRDRLGEFTAQVVGVRAGLVAAVMVVAWALSYALGGTAGWLTRLYALSFLPQVVYVVNMLYGVEWTWPVTVYFIGGRLVYVGLLAALVRDAADVGRVALAFGAAILVENVYVFVTWWRRYGCVWRGMRTRIHWWHWRAAVPISVAMGGALLHENAAMVLVYLLRGAAEAGVYSAAFRLVYVAISLTQLCSYVYLARFMRERAASVTHARKLFVQAWLLAACGGVVLAVCGMGLADIVVRTLYREEYRASASVLAWGMWQMAVAPARVVAFQTLTACRAHAWLNRVVWLGVVCSVAASAAGAKYAGAAGAALGSVVGEAVMCSLLSMTAWQALRRVR